MTHSQLAAPAPFRYAPPHRLSSLSVVMPAHNEAENIEAAVLEGLEAASMVADRYEVVVIDDGSTDATAAIVTAMAKVYGDSVRLIRNEHNMGYGPTARRAWTAARMEWLLFTDSDCQFDLREVVDLVPLTDRADIVSGWRKDRQDPWPRKLNAHIFNLAGRLAFGTGVKDIDCAFKLMRTAALRELDLTANSAMVNTELLYQVRQHGMTVAELPVTHRERQFGEASGGDLKVIARAMREFFTMRHRFNRPEPKRLRLHSWLVGLLALTSGLAATGWAFATHTVLAYGDAEAHLNISKRVVSGLTAGLAQLGSVWLPLPHLLMLPFVANDDLWRTGLAGAAVGVPALVLAAVMSYRTAHLLTGSIAASWLAPLIIIGNPNTLYLAATPMTELLLLAMVTASLYYLTRWVLHDGVTNLVIAGIFASLASVSRYDGWAAVCIETVAVVIVAAARYRARRSVEGLSVLFGVLAFSGIAGWLLWNQLIFSNPLYFAQSVYGSAEQQQFFLRTGLLPTYHDVGKSVVYWFEDVRIIAGSTLGALAGLGLASLVVAAVRRRRVGPILIAGTALSCFAFYILSLYLGQASLILPRFAPPGAPYTMSNLRYGLQALMPIGIFVAYLGARRPRLLVPILVLVVVVQGGFSVVTGRVMAYQDGTQGLSSQLVSKGPDSPVVEDWLHHNYDGGLVLMDDYRRPIGPVESGIPMSAFIGVGNKPYWQESLDNPGQHATWIIVQQADTDAVWTGFSPQSRSILADHFVQVFRSGNILVYKKRPDLTDIMKQGQHLYLNGQRWNSVGVNSYDLLEQSQSVIDDRLTNLAQGGHNTLRTWCFDKDGGISDATLSKLAVTLNTARERGIRVVCTLGNTLPDFGGQSYFTPAGQDFFGSPGARTQYREQIVRLLNYRDAHGVRLADQQAVLAWDLLNEPRPNPTTDPGAVADWTQEMSSFVGSLDQRHLITIGAEGFGPGYPDNPTLAGRPGAEFATLCQIPSITLCAAHVFPNYLANPSDSVALGHVVHTWRTTADRLNKPMFLEEVGYSSTQAKNFRTRQAFFDNVSRAINNSDLDGGLLWNLGAHVDAAYTLQYGDTSSNRTLSAWATLINKSR
jgi:hypothetical protein